MTVKRFQRVISVIPYLSSVIIVFRTMFVFRKRKASALDWAKAILLFFLSGVVVWLVNTLLLSDKSMLLVYLVDGVILFFANWAMIELQETCRLAAEKKSPTTIKTGVMIAAALVFAVFVFVALMVYKLATPSKLIEDANGLEDTSLAVITTEEIQTVNDDYSAYAVHESTSGRQTGVEGREEDYDHDTVSFGCEQISGVKTLQVTKLSGDSIELRVDCELMAGNAEMFVFVDDILYSSIEPMGEQTLSVSGEPGQLVTVKLAAESAKMSISLDRGVS